jgi:hypothetical protein
MLTMPRTPRGLVEYALQALGKSSVSVKALVFFLSFDLRRMPPSRAKELLQQLRSSGHIFIEDGQVQLGTNIEAEPQSTPKTTTANLGELLKQFVSSPRLTRAVGMEDNAVRFTRPAKPPFRIEARVFGSREYRLVLDEANKRIEHNCPDWRRVSVLQRFCKHVAKLFLLLDQEDAVRILESLREGSWEFVFI